MRALLLPSSILLVACATPLAPALRPLFTPPDVPPRADLRSPLLFDDGTPVRSGKEWPRRRAEIRKAWHAAMGPWPPSITPPQVRELAVEVQDGYTRETLEFQSAPGRTTPAYLLRPDGDGRKPAVVVLFYDPETLVGLARRAPLRDFGLALTRAGFITLNVGLQPAPKDAPVYYPSPENARLQPLSFLAYVAANAYDVLAARADVDRSRVGVFGHSYGGKWAMFSAALDDRFAAVAVSDPAIVFDESGSAANYWDPWYLGYEPGRAGLGFRGVQQRGAYKRLRAEDRDLHELHALLAPRPFFVSGGTADTPAQWGALAHLVQVNRLLGHEGRVGMANRPAHAPSPESVAQVSAFFRHFLGR